MPFNPQYRLTYIYTVTLSKCCKRIKSTSSITSPVEALTKFLMAANHGVVENYVMSHSDQHPFGRSAYSPHFI